MFEEEVEKLKKTQASVLGLSIGARVGVVLGLDRDFFERQFFHGSLHTVASNALSTNPTSNDLSLFHDLDAL